MPEWFENLLKYFGYKTESQRNAEEYARKTTHVVKPGDNLSSIAAKFGTTVDYLTRYNRIQNPNNIQIGDTIRYSPIYVDPSETDEEHRARVERILGDYKPSNTSNQSTQPSLPNPNSEIKVVSRPYRSYKDSKYSSASKNPNLDQRINWENMDWLNDYFTRKLGPNTAKAILSSIAVEGLGDPYRKQNNGPGYGLLQWENDPKRSDDRYDRMMEFPYKDDEKLPNGIDKELKRQADFIIHTVLDKVHSDDWRFGFGFNEAEQAQNKFINRNTSGKDKARIISTNYVRPKAGIKEAKRRSEVIYPIIDSLYNENYLNPNLKNPFKYNK